MSALSDRVLALSQRASQVLRRVVMVRVLSVVLRVLLGLLGGC
jgi:hypothetical protein